MSEEFEKEWTEMWQESTCPMPGGPGQDTLRLAAWVKQVDRRVFRRNFIEYVAAGIVFIRSVMDIAAGDRPLIASLTSIAACVFIASYLWRKHRDTPPLDPASTATAYRTALLDRLDRQIRLARSVRYWYVLPVWVVFLVVFVWGAVGLFANGPEGAPAAMRFVFLTVEFLLATGVGVLVVWLNERYRLRKLLAERQQVEGIDKGASGRS
jgi:hypothetical protein